MYTTGVSDVCKMSIKFICVTYVRGISVVYAMYCQQLKKQHMLDATAKVLYAICSMLCVRPYRLDVICYVLYLI